MEATLRDSIQSIQDVFPVSEVNVFGSYARGDERPDSDIDLLVVCSETSRDLFELTYETRKYLHDRIDLALDVMLTTESECEKRRSQPWTLEYTARAEGVTV